jgi:hypothetical protein
MSMGRLPVLVAFYVPAGYFIIPISGIIFTAVPPDTLTDAGFVV